jgi:hypothetical protein
MDHSAPILLLAKPNRPEARFDPAAIFAPGAVLPEQLESSTQLPAAGSRALMLAVLEEAILCIVGDDAKVDVSGKHSREAARARQWVGARDPSWLFSFENVCMTLDIEPEPLRDALLVKLRHGDVKAIRTASHRVIRNRTRVEQKREKRAGVTRRRARTKVRRETRTPEKESG